MTDSEFRLSYPECLETLSTRLAEPPPGRIQLLAGPRQVGKTTLLSDLADRLGPTAVYSAADGPEAALPGHWERLWARAEETAAARGRAVVLLDEVHRLPDWVGRLKGIWDRLRRRRTPVHVVATGSSSLHLARGSRESLAGRFERLTLTHWSARALAAAFRLPEREAATLLVQQGAYPGAMELRRDTARWSAYVRDAILEPALGRDLLALAPIRRPALLRQIFFLAASAPAQIVSLQKLQGQLQDPGALETIASYLALLEEAFLVAALPKYAATAGRRRAAPPKLVVLSNALVAVAARAAGAPGPDDAPALGAWVENACLAHAVNAGQRVSYWREEPLEVDGVVEGSWGRWALEVKTGGFQVADLRGLLEFTRRHPAFHPLVICSEPGLAVAARAGIEAMTWLDFLLRGP